LVRVRINEVIRDDLNCRNGLELEGDCVLTVHIKHIFILFLDERIICRPNVRKLFYEVG